MQQLLAGTSLAATSYSYFLQLLLAASCSILQHLAVAAFIRIVDARLAIRQVRTRSCLPPAPPPTPTATRLVFHTPRCVPTQYPAPRPAPPALTFQPSRIHLERVWRQLVHFVVASVLSPRRFQRAFCRRDVAGPNPTQSPPPAAPALPITWAARPSAACAGGLSMQPAPMPRGRPWC